jgi:hypothetical protein
VEEALTEVQQSFEKLCLAAGMEALGAMMEAESKRPAVRATGG